MARPTMAMMAGVPPQYITNVTTKQIVKAAPAVMNHPPMTESTPVMRNTALSRPHALSAKDEPIATMKATYVVESGSFREVPTAISKPERTTFTEARTKSKLALFSMIISELSKRLFNHTLTGSGMTLVIVIAILVVVRTRTRATGDVPKLSSPSDWRERSREVFTTLCAFLEVSNAITMTIPAPIRKYHGVWAGSKSEVIRKVSVVVVPP